MRSFIVSALRRSSTRWQPKNEAIKRAFVGDGTNPKTGRKCKLHKCEQSGELVAKGDMQADHIEPVVPTEGWGKTTSYLGINWNEYIPRMFCEADGFQAVSKEWHKQKTNEERKQRKKT